jgi:glyoxylate/hydroxypyruvate reductase A
MMVWNPPEGMISGLTSLKGVISLAQGVDHVLKDPSFPHHLKLARLIDPYMSEAMAEWVLLAILGHHRDVAIYRQGQTDHEWIWREPKIAADNTVAIMGLGAIGSHVASKVAMMGFRTIGWSRSKKKIASVISHTGTDGFETCLAEADYLVSILPLTEETRDLYDASCFSKMKPGGIFINSGRGLQVVEDDLIQALDRDVISAAVLDVFRAEPLPANHPMWSHPRIEIWPHVSAQTNATSAGEQIIEAITAIRAGRDPKNSVDVSRGY